MPRRNRSSSVPESAITVTRYSQLEDFATKFAAGSFNLIGVVGTAGLRKSRTFIQLLESSGERYYYVKGYTKPFILYQLLYRHRDERVVIDDADSLFADRACVPLLKSLLETEETKVVSWHSRAIDDEEIPRSFATRSKVTVLCNEWRTVNDNMRAVEDRGIFIHFTPSVSEVHAKMAEASWFKDEEVFRFIGKHLHLITEPSIRYYLKASEMRTAGIEDWEGTTLRMLNPNVERLAIVSRLLADEGITNEAERVAKYVELTGCSQATFYRDRELLLKARGEQG